NCDATGVDYVIPSNDDAIRAIKLLVGKIADAVLEGKALRKEEVVEEEVEPTFAVAPTAVRYTMLDEEEIGDEDLLGDATLAKLSGRPARKAIEDEEEEEVEDIEEIEAEDEEEA